MSTVNISSMYMTCDRVIAEHNQASGASWRYGQQTVFNTGAPGEVTWTTRFKVRIENLAASRLDESNDKALSAKHAYQAELKDLTV